MSEEMVHWIGAIFLVTILSFTGAKCAQSRDSHELRLMELENNRPAENKICKKLTCQCEDQP